MTDLIVKANSLFHTDQSGKTGPFFQKKISLSCRFHLRITLEEFFKPLKVIHLYSSSVFNTQKYTQEMQIHL